MNKINIYYMKLISHSGNEMTIGIVFYAEFDFLEI